MKAITENQSHDFLINSGPFRKKYRVSQKICYNPAHTIPFSCIHLLDVQGVDTFIYWLSVFNSRGFSFLSLKKPIICMYCLKS